MWLPHTHCMLYAIGVSRVANFILGSPQKCMIALLSSSDWAYLTKNRVVPHPLYSSPQTRICLITADGPADDTFKKLVKDPEFPKDLERKLVKVIRYSRLAKKYNTYE